MSKSRNTCNEVSAAVMAQDCTLPARCRHMALTLAYLADWRTGRGLAGQGRLARAMGCDVRTVQRTKRQLAEATDSPVTITWSHRQRADGLNGSDAYTIAAKKTADTNADTADTLAPHTRQHAVPISPQVPQRDTLGIVGSEIISPGEGPQAPPGLKLIGAAEWRGPNAQHAKAAAAKGISAAELTEVAADWRAYWVRQGEARTQLQWAATFGGWIKRRDAVEVPEAAEADANPAPVGPTAAEIMAQRRRHRAASGA